MGIIDRLSDVIRSYLNEDSFSYEKKRRTYGVDSDLEAAYEELNEFLGRGEGRGASHDFGAQNDAGFGGQFRNVHTAAAPKAAPEALRPAFAELGVPFGADPEVCKTAYKKLLKVHHPDRHAGHVENMRKATEKSARINAAYEKIERWRATGTV
ncbi:MAG: DnaJ domain-containing protein [Treponema sp.]|nr:DnaJ domain-containing protein [Treponema sp.]